MSHIFFDPPHIIEVVACKPLISAQTNL